jgi:hypothetical protein
MNVIKDTIFIEKKRNLASTLNFLNALKTKLNIEDAVEIAEIAAANHLIQHYKEIFKGTIPESQERFDVFRKYYEAYPLISSYCEIIESNKDCLKVKFNRCPHAEILSDEDLFEFAPASCKSDIAFTEELLPGVKFSRESSIVDGDKTCIMVWEK